MAQDAHGHPGCTSKATSRLAHVRLTSYMVILRSPASTRRVSNRRLKLRGSNRVPALVVNTSEASRASAGAPRLTRRQRRQRRRPRGAGAAPRRARRAGVRAPVHASRLSAGPGPRLKAQPRKGTGRGNLNEDFMKTRFFTKSHFPAIRILTELRTACVNDIGTCVNDIGKCARTRRGRYLRAGTAGTRPGAVDHPERGAAAAPDLVRPGGQLGSARIGRPDRGDGGGARGGGRQAGRPDC